MRLAVDCEEVSDEFVLELCGQVIADGEETSQVIIRDGLRNNASKRIDAPEDSLPSRVLFITLDELFEEEDDLFGTAAESHRRFMSGATWIEPLKDISLMDARRAEHRAWVKETFDTPFIVSE